MKAIRVNKRGKASIGLTCIHLLVDDGRTFCGRAVADLDVIEQLDLDADPRSDVACLQCLRIRDRVKHTRTPMPHSESESRVFLSPAPGRMRATGSLSHGTRITRGHIIR